MIGIVNYGLGNIIAFENIIKNFNVEYCIINSFNDFNKCSKIILPGVGSFDEAIIQLKKKNFYEKLNEEVKLKNKPVLGICVGMQIMFNQSEEGIEKGFGWITGKVKKFKIDNLILPHMGWNELKNLKDDYLFNDIKDHSFYFLHSYFVEPNDLKDINAYCNYSQDFPACVKKNNVYGVQFHPEKSHDSGIQLLNNFIIQCH